MTPGASTLLFAGGLLLVVYFAEKLVKAVVGTSLVFGLSPFVISVIFVGFDPENLAVGTTASYEEAAGIALGSVVGATMVAIALAFGISAVIAPMTFRSAPKQVLAVPVIAVLIFGGLCFDGQLSRLDGGLLLIGFVAAVLQLLRLSQRGLDIEPSGEVAETLAEEGASRLKEGRLPRRTWRTLGLLFASLGAIILGSELMVKASQVFIEWLGLSETVFGMTVLALVVSIEEVARELPAALKGRPEISYGNVSGSVLSFFLFNAGIMAMVRPIPVTPMTNRFYIPICLVTLILVSVLMAARTIPQWAGAALVMLYLVFFVGGYLLA